MPEPRDTSKRMEGLKTILCQMAEPAPESNAVSNLPYLAKRIAEETAGDHALITFHAIYLDAVMKDESLSKEVMMDRLCGVQEYMMSSEDGTYDDNMISFVRVLNTTMTSEIQRVNAVETMIDRLNEKDEEIRNLAAKSKELEESLRKTRKRAKGTMVKLKRLHVENFQTLAIFAAIVITFTGGLSLIGGIITMGEVCIFKIVMLTLVVGLVLVNSIAILLFVAIRVIRIPYDVADPDYSIKKRERFWKVVDRTATSEGDTVNLVRWIDVLFIVLIVVNAGLWFHFGNFPATM